MSQRDYSNLSGLGVDREGLTPKQYKRHLAELQQRLRDLQEEMRTLTGGGRGQVPATTKKSFRLAAPNTSTALDKVEVPTSLRTATKSRVKHDLVTRAELESRVSSASSATGFMDLLSNQSVESGNKDFGSISFQQDDYQLTPGTNYPIVDLSGATLWRLSADSVTSGTVKIHSFTRPNPDTGMFRIVIWTSYSSTLTLVHNSTYAGITANGRIESLSATSSAVQNQEISTTGPGAFILVYNQFGNRWTVISRNA